MTSVLTTTPSVRFIPPARRRANVVTELFFAATGFTSIAALTWFFSFRPRFYIRTFVPRENYRDAIMQVLREPGFCRGMRQMAQLQFGVALLFWIVTLSRLLISQ